MTCAITYSAIATPWAAAVADPDALIGGPLIHRVIKAGIERLQHIQPLQFRHHLKRWLGGTQRMEVAGEPKVIGLDLAAPEPFCHRA